MRVAWIALGLMSWNLFAATEAGVRRCKHCSSARGLTEQATDIAAVGSCSIARYTAAARSIGSSTNSGGLCLPAVKRALDQAGCAYPDDFRNNAMQAFAAAKRGGWRCQSGGTARGAPDGAILFSRGCGSHHTEIKSGNCYYSDFHHTDCLASSEYNGCKYRQLGWCLPRGAR